MLMKFDPRKPNKYQWTLMSAVVIVMKPIYDCIDDQIEGGSTVALDLQGKKISDWETRIRSHGCSSS